jgi:hypothetical protein
MRLLTGILQEMNQMSKTLLAGPESGVNYGKLTARAPELTAQILNPPKRGRGGVSKKSSGIPLLT